MSIIGRKAEIRELQKYKNSIHITMVTTYGIAEKGYRASVQSEVTLDDLFETV